MQKFLICENFFVIHRLRTFVSKVLKLICFGVLSKVLKLICFSVFFILEGPPGAAGPRPPQNEKNRETN